MADIAIQYVATVEQIVDIFTKALDLVTLSASLTLKNLKIVW